MLYCVELHVSSPSVISIWIFLFNGKSLIRLFIISFTDINGNFKLVEPIGRMFLIFSTKLSIFVFVNVVNSIISYIDSSKA